MKATIKIILFLTIIVSLISVYWVLARYTDLIYDDVLEINKWGNVSPFFTLITGLISIFILLITLIFYNPIFQVLKISKTLIIAFSISGIFVTFATMTWAESWFGNNYFDPDTRELGDAIWTLGNPLTFLIIDLPIYIRHKFEQTDIFWSDLWAYPCVLILFLIQFMVYVHGIRLIISLKKIKTAYNTMHN